MNIFNFKNTLRFEGKPSCIVKILKNLEIKFRKIKNSRVLNLEHFRAPGHNSKALDQWYSTWGTRVICDTLTKKF